MWKDRLFRNRCICNGNSTHSHVESCATGTDGLLKEVFANKGVITAKDVMDCARNGDPLAQKVVKEVAVYLGLVLANIANTLNPAKIVIGGGVSKAGDVLLNTCNRSV